MYWRYNPVPSGIHLRDRVMNHCMSCSGRCTKYALWLLIISFSFIGILTAQEEAVNLDPDSLLVEVTKATQPFAKAELYLLLGNAWLNKETSKAREYADYAQIIGKTLKNKVIIGRAQKIIGFSYFRDAEYELAETSYKDAMENLTSANDQKEISMVFMNMGLLAQQRNNDQLALYYFEKSIAIKEKVRDKPGMGKGYLNTGNIYYFRGDYDLGAKWYLKALRILEETGDELMAAKTINNIGNIYLATGNYPKAMEYYQRGYFIRNNLHDKKGIALSYNNFGSVHYSLAEYDSALYYFNKSLEIKREFNDLYSIAGTLGNIGGVYRAMKDFTQARRYYEEALELRKKLNNHFELATAYINMGEFFLDLGMRNEANRYHLMGIKLAEKNGYQKILSVAYQRLSLSAAERKDYKKAYEYHQKHLLAREAEFKESYKKNIEEIEHYKMDELEKINEMLRQETQIQSLQIYRDRIRRFSILIVSALLLFILATVLLVLSMRYRRKTRINKQLKEKNQLITRQKELYASSLLKINRSEKRFRGVFENQVAGMLIITMDGIIMESNERITELFHTERNKLAGMSINSFFSDDDLVEVMTIIRSLNSSEKGRNSAVFKIASPKGEKRWMNISISSIRGDQEETDLCTLIMVDVDELFRLKEEASKAREEFESILSSITDLVFSISFKEGTGLYDAYFSPAVEKITGISPKELMSDPDYCLALLHPDDRNFFDIIAEKVIDSRSREEIETEFRLIGKNGEIHWLQQKITVYSIAGGARRINGVIRDITDFKQTKTALINSEYLYRSTIDSLTEHCIHVIDESFEIKVFNFAFRMLNSKLGLRKDVIGENLFDVYPFLGKKVRNEYQKVFKQGKTLSTMEALIVSGIEMTTETYKVPVIHNGVVRQVITIMKDITEEVKAREVLKVSEEKYRLASMSKDKFFSVIAHDLMSPFNALLGLSGVLYEMYDEYTDEERKSHAGKILELSELIYKMAENLLIWSRAQTGRIKKELVITDLTELVQAQIELFIPLSVKKQIRLTSGLEHDGHIMTDPNLLSIVLRNLIGNAIKFTPHGGRVAVTIKMESDAVRIMVEDTGIGIPREIRESIWTPGGVVKRPGTDREMGTGLGLMICKEYIEMINGTIELESEMGKGSRFVINLPA